VTNHNFNGKVALVTGAAGGIGRASALAFARHGAKVVVADVQTAGGEETARQIKQAGGDAAFVRAEISQTQEVRSLIRQTLTLFGRIDFAHNNAGIEGVRARTAALKEEDWDRVIGINLKGTWLSMKFEIPEMLKQGAGAIVNTASVAGQVGLSRFAAYAASKHGIVGLTQSAALEYARFGIRINAVCPGMIDTELLSRGFFGTPKSHSLVDRFVHRWRRRIGKKILTATQPARRMGSADEVAEAVVWLCSDSASFVTGHALAVDGGYLAK
jgi:NAD(P)-dependent dehydrogenase (short-subunit alcohol dehydrogenase family)